MDMKSFLGGFVSGEGCFTFQITKNCIAPIFSITLNVNDIQLLEKIKDELKCGKIYILKKGVSCALKTVSIEDSSKIEKYFEGFLLGDKLNDFLFWKEGLIRLNELRSKGREEMKKYSDDDLIYFKSLTPSVRKRW